METRKRTKDGDNRGGSGECCGPLGLRKSNVKSKKTHSDKAGFVEDGKKGGQYVVLWWCDT